MKDKDPFINWYKERFDKLNQEPPEEVWNSVSQNISINEAWQGIDAKLTSVKRRKVIVRRSLYAVSLLLFLFFTGNLIFNMVEESVEKKYNNTNPITENRTEKIKKQAKFISKKEFSVSIETQSKQHKLKNEFSVSVNNSSSAFSSSINKNKQKKYFVKAAITLAKTPKYLEAISSKNSENAEAKEDYANENILANNTIEVFVSMPIRTLNISNETPLLLITKNRINVPDSNYVIKQSSVESKFRGWYAGGVYSINNVWLLNSQTFNGLKSNTLDKTNINSGSSYGISAGYGFRNKWNAELNWYLQSHQGQTYHIYSEGRCKMNTIKLNYTAFNLAVKHRNEGYSRWFNLPKSVNLIAGINFGLLREADDNLIADTEQEKSMYSTIDYGLRIGCEYEILTFKRILFSSAILADIGLKNIYNGTYNEPSTFNRTQTASLGLQIGLKYLFR